MQPNPSDIDLDLRGVYCPMAFVKLRIYADQLAESTIFTALFEQTNANKPLIRSIKSLGHLIKSEEIIEPHENKTSQQLSQTPVVMISVQVKKSS